MNFLKKLSKFLNSRKQLIKLEKEITKEKRKRLSKKQLKLMRQLKKEGHKAKEIAKMLGVSSASVTYHLTYRNKSGKVYKLSPDERKIIRERYYDDNQRVRAMLKRHRTNTPKNHINCPVCYPEKIPKGMNMNTAIDEYVQKTRSLNFSQYQWAKKHKLDKIKTELKKKDIEKLIVSDELPSVPPRDFLTHDKLLPEVNQTHDEIKINKKVPSIWCPTCHNKKVNCTCVVRGGFIN